MNLVYIKVHFTFPHRITEAVFISQHLNTLDMSPFIHGLSLGLLYLSGGREIIYKH